MDSQFRCKCGKPMAYSNEPCKNCGSLGPHAYAGKPGPPAVTSQIPPQQRRPENIPVDRGERLPPASAGREGPVDYEPPDTGDIVHEKGRGQHDAAGFPVGISRRAEILNHIERLDSEGEKGTDKRRKKARERAAAEDWDTDESPARVKHYESFLDGEEEEEKPGKRGSGLTGSIISIILVVALIICALWAYSNQEEISGWLMSPTTPETVPASDQPANPSDSGQGFFAGLLNMFKWGQATPVSTDNTSTPAAPSNQTEPAATDNVQAPLTPAVPSDSTPPVISEILIKSITDHGAAVSWKTDELCTSRVTYKTEVGEPHVLNGMVTPTRYHQADLSGLESGKNYYITIISRDDAGNEDRQERSFQTLLSAADTTEPQLTGERTASAGDTTATISWKTNEKARSQVKYSLGTGYEFHSGFTNDYGDVHSIFLSGLSPNTEYHYQLISRDASGNVMTSGDYTFRTEPETGAAPYMGSKAPNFTLRNLQGETVSLSQFRGQKVILNFWASWCTPCKIEMPHFQTLWARYNPGADFVILSVAGSQSEEALIRDFVTDGNYTFPICLDPGEDAFNKYELTSIPKTYFIDKDGIIRRIQQGMFTGPGEIEFMLNSY
ncbi:MAG: redoxin domain-containing protein [Dehalococcoidia bacterium]|nr:redoxin domain-containing protein [Dehalococcoidia bacterium]